MLIGRSYLVAVILTFALVNLVVESAPQAYERRDPGHPQWHHGAFQDVKDSVRSDVREMLHSRAEVQVLVCLYVHFSFVNFRNPMTKNMLHFCCGRIIIFLHNIVPKNVLN